MRWQVSRQIALGWRPLGVWPLSAVVVISLISQARSRGCGGRWLRRAKTHVHVAGARWSITVRGAALLAGENPRHASCGSIRRRRTRPAEAASQLRAKQPDSLASSASMYIVFDPLRILDDVTQTHTTHMQHTQHVTHTTSKYMHAHTYHTHTQMHVPTQVHAFPATSAVLPLSDSIVRTEVSSFQAHGVNSHSSASQSAASYYSPTSQLCMSRTPGTTPTPFGEPERGVPSSRNMSNIVISLFYQSNMTQHYIRLATHSLNMTQSPSPDHQVCMHCT